ncbi:hypothetical protein [Streptomyces coffeae]|uniref:Transposase n=1 Tax=Streptomyces coffeae TaxID=621382 RepID=A0ABS1NJI0_9ACTN|nr:hypothetical protein [Streptomyces coffeae]MBL1100233.1 hypothetical protein [Streptomyces coffeae]
MAETDQAAAMAPEDGWRLAREALSLLTDDRSTNVRERMIRGRYEILQETWVLQIRIQIPRISPQRRIHRSIRDPRSLGRPAYVTTVMSGTCRGDGNTYRSRIEKRTAPGTAHRSIERYKNCG